MEGSPLLRILRVVPGILILLLILSSTQVSAQPGGSVFISLPPKENRVDIYLFKEIEVPEGKVLRAWTIIDAVHEYSLFINGREASRSRLGRVASSWRRCQEIEELGNPVTR